jgi:hypothetical protein
LLTAVAARGECTVRSLERQSASSEERALREERKMGYGDGLGYEIGVEDRAFSSETQMREGTLRLEAEFRDLWLARTRRPRPSSHAWAPDEDERRTAGNDAVAA